MKTTVIFDFDGVIGETDTFNARVIGEIMNNKLIPFSEEIYKEFFFGHTLRDGLSAYFKKINLYNEDLIDAIIQLKKGLTQNTVEALLPILTLWS